jgi:acetyltransferase-like isoleucine patch superfamily enzyme
MRYLRYWKNIIRRLKLKLRGNKICKTSVIWNNVRVHGSGLSVGCMSGLGDNVVIWANSEVVIGNNVLIAANSVITSAGHPADIRIRHDVISSPIRIDDYCWIGANCTILPGVHLRKNTIVAAGSVVTNQINVLNTENSLIGGVPAKIIKKLD